MKNYLLSKDGLKQISEVDLARFKSQGGFMSTDGQVLFPRQLVKEEADAVGELLSRAQNFVYWFTPDFRACFVTKDGLINTSGKFWKVRFEWRGVDAKGRTAAAVARFEKKVPIDMILPALENAFSNLLANIQAATQQPLPSQTPNEATLQAQGEDRSAGPEEGQPS